jgi:hypothetical protein
MRMFTRKTEPAVHANESARSSIPTELKSRCQFPPDKEQNDRADNGQDKTGSMKA